MKKVILILFLIATNLVIGQNFAQLGAKWHFKKYCPTPDFINDCGYFTLEAIRDTLILGKTSKIIEYADNGIVGVNGQLILYSDSNRVYFYENAQFKLLYDFNLIAGDTLSYSIPTNWKKHELGCSDFPNTSKRALAIIDSVVIKNISGQPLKFLYTSPVPFPDTNFYFDWSIEYFAERIGGSIGLFGQSVPQCLAGYPGHFRCYSDSLINYKPVPENCEFVAGIETINNRNELNIYPNPAFTFFTIEGFQWPYSLFVYNAMGQLLYRENNIIARSKRVDLRGYKSGLLLIKVESAEEVFYSKILKK